MDCFDLINAGLKFHESFRYSEAMPYFQDALKSHPNCPCAIYNVANTWHNMGENKKSKSLLHKFLATKDQILKEGCPESHEPVESFKLVAYFLLFHVTLAITKSFEQAEPYAIEHLNKRRRGLLSVWSKREVLKQIKQAQKEFGTSPE